MNRNEEMGSADIEVHEYVMENFINNSTWLGALGHFLHTIGQFEKLWQYKIFYLNLSNY